MSHQAHAEDEGSRDTPDMSPRGLTLLLAGGFIAYLVLMHPRAATPVLVAVGVVTVLNLLVGRKRK